MKAQLPSFRIRLLTVILALFTGSLAQQSFAQTTTLVNQNFGTTTAFPTGWSGTSGWSISTANGSTGGYTGASGGSNALSTAVANSTQTLTFSNSLSTVGYSSVTVIWGARIGSSFPTVTLSYSIDAAGTVYTPVSYTQVASSNTWDQVNGGVAITLPANAAGVANLRLKWSIQLTGSTFNRGYQIDDVIIQGIVPGTLTTSSPSLAFGTVTTSTNSASQTFNLSGANLSGAPGNIIVTAPTGYQVSSDNITWANTAAIAYSSATLAATPVYVRFTPTTGAAQNGTLTFSGGGASPLPTVALTGTGSGAAFIPATSDNFRSQTNGSWNSSSTWQAAHVATPTAWFNTTATPTSNSGTIAIQSANIVTVTAAVTADQITVNAGGELDVNATLTLNNGAGTDLDVSGIVDNTSTISTGAASLVFETGSVYNHDQDGGTVPTATWSTGSVCDVTGTVNAGTIAGLNQNFADFMWDCSGQNSDVTLGTGTTAVLGTFTVNRTGSGTLQLPNGSQASVTVGNFIQTGGTVYVANGSTSARTLTVTHNFTLNQNTGTSAFIIAANGASSTHTLNVGGNFTHTAGTISRSSATANIVFNGSTTQTYTSGGTVTGAVNFTVNSGTTLQMGTGAAPSIITGAGIFLLSDGATLGVTSPVGITSTGATGNIQTTTRTYFQTLGSSSFIYNGNVAQVTGAGLPATVGTFNISNATGVALTNALTVNSALTLISGNIDASAKNLTLATAAVLSGTGGSASSYVVTGNGAGTTGTLTRNIAGSATSLFPIGNAAYYLPVTISGNAGTQIISAYVFQGATTTGVFGTGTPLDKSGIVDAVWTLNRTSGSGSSNILLKWDAALEGVKFAAYSNGNIGISNYTTAWQAATATIAGDNVANTVGSAFSSFSHFGVGAINDPLPVVLVGFNAVLNGKSVDLSWTTQQEINSSYFDIERSADGSNWSAISRVQAKGNAAYVSNYTASDAAPLSGINYYRLKMVDLDGRYGYTEIKLVRTSTITGLSVFPNPAKDYVNVSIGASTSEITIRLFNQSGQVLQEKRVNGANAGIVSLPVHDYARGTYLLQVSSADGSQQTIKVLVTQ